MHFARQILEQQPESSALTWNRMDYRPLEGFVLAITPFNFTAIAGNLPSAPALLGNVVVWKPSPTQQLAAHHTMALFEAAGLPPGVINMVTGDGAAVSEAALPHPALAGIHFTGSTATFQHLWRTVAAGIGSYATYPRLVGETGGKDFVVAHPSADPAALVTGLVRGAFEYQGQKCSAASRAYVPRSLWEAGVRDELVAVAESLSYGDVHELRLLRRSGDRPPLLRPARPACSTACTPSRASACWPAARPTTRSATSSSRPCSRPPTRPTRCSATSTSARSSACTSTTTTRGRRRSCSSRRSRRTR